MKVICKDIECEVEQILKPENRHSYFRICPPNKFIITTPKLYSDSDITKIVELHYTAISRVFKKYPKKKDSSIIHILGKEYKIVIKSSRYDFANIDGDTFLIFTDNEEKIPKIVFEYYKYTLEKIVNIHLEGLKKEFDINFNIDFQIKDTKTYYGKCFIKKRKIVLSSFLAKYDIKYIMSVLFHELTHFYVSNHQKEFYDFIEKHIPNYKAIDKELKSIHYADLY